MREKDKRILAKDVVWPKSKMRTSLSQVSKYRDRYEIIETILRTAQEYRAEGVRAKEICIKTEKNAERFQRYINFLLRKQLLETYQKEDTVFYRINEKGEKWLAFFRQLKAILIAV